MVQWGNSTIPRRTCLEYPSIVSIKSNKNQEGAREGRTGLKVTYPLIPGVPELVESLVEKDRETEGASEDASDEDACQGEHEFPGI